MADCLESELFVDEKRLNEVLEKARAFALTKGICMQSEQRGQDGTMLAQHFPFTLFPSVVPRTCFQEAVDCMLDFNTLIHKVAHDHNFLEKALKNVLKVDEFTKGLWQIYTQVREEGYTQPLSLGLFRNDFMIDVQDPDHVQIKQVEINTIAAGAGSLGSLLVHLHSVLEVDEFTQGLWKIYTQVREEGYTQPLSLGLFRNDFMIDVQDPDHVQIKQVEINTIAAGAGSLGSLLVYLHRFTLDLIGKHYDNREVQDNNSSLGAALGLLKAWELYGRKQAAILFVVRETESNIFDQRLLEFKVLSINSRVRVIRGTYMDIYNGASLTEDKRLLVDGDEVAVVYLRAGYAPDDVPTHKEWDARLKLERSLAIKCPSIQYHLAGLKKIQQELSLPGSVEQFMKDPAAVKRIRATFVKQYSLDVGPEGDKGVELGKTDPDMYVLKPQREGGGNNLYGDDIREFLETHQNSTERNAYILMERIFPKTQKNYLVTPGRPFVLSDVTSELGIFGVFLGSATEEKINMQCGHMLRTKLLGTDDSGLRTGHACLDTPFLVNEEL
ncbi:LOW QUALITY PROTEIN: glutathione synthetase-like [Haliotis rubra]|uniref:LOW QUALITY PROTEIN: glutathione synthetase-like n=1 Tax=Haliotis rubra TaxID=36100 RepID=UPI001EE5A2B5|nr:LOW QUALITY PROTEIN: glutathione synthetase-like [Haliotis rubra]